MKFDWIIIIIKSCQQHVFFWLSLTIHSYWPSLVRSSKWQPESFYKMSKHVALETMECSLMDLKQDKMNPKVGQWYASTDAGWISLIGQCLNSSIKKLLLPVYKGGIYWWEKQRSKDNHDFKWIYSTNIAQIFQSIIIHFVKTSHFLIR